MAGGTSGLFPSLAEQKKHIEEERKAAALAAAGKIPYEKQLDVYNAAIRAWGVQAQSWMVVEEMSELAKEICKLQRRPAKSLDALADEIADVKIMLEQLCIMHNVHQLVYDHMDKKIERLAERLGLTEGEK